MISRPLTVESLERALSHIDDFYAVQKESQWADLVAAMTVLRESLGIEDEAINVSTAWCENRWDESGAEEKTPLILLGLMIGLIAADYDHSA